MNILFVCTGNISRSFLAETLLIDEIKKNRTTDINVSSVGTGAYPGSSADQEMVNFLKDMEIPVEDHYSRMISKKDIEWADLVLVMEVHHSEFIKNSWPKYEGNIELLGKYIAADTTDDEIPDPYGRPAYHYRIAQSQIALAISNLYKVLSEKQ